MRARQQAQTLLFLICLALAAQVSTLKLMGAGTIWQSPPPPINSPGVGVFEFFYPIIPDGSLTFNDPGDAGVLIGLPPWERRGYMTATTESPIKDRRIMSWIYLTHVQPGAVPPDAAKLVEHFLPSNEFLRRENYKEVYSALKAHLDFIVGLTNRPVKLVFASHFPENGYNFEKGGYSDTTLAAEKPPSRSWDRPDVSTTGLIPMRLAHAGKPYSYDFIKISEDVAREMSLGRRRRSVYFVLEAGFTAMPAELDKSKIEPFLWLEIKRLKVYIYGPNPRLQRLLPSVSAETFCRLWHNEPRLMA